MKALLQNLLSFSIRLIFFKSSAISSTLSAGEILMPILPLWQDKTRKAECRLDERQRNPTEGLGGGFYTVGLEAVECTVVFQPTD